MGRIKVRKEIIHQPSTPEVLQCLGSMPVYSKILSENTSDKHYSDFLKWLLSAIFYNRQEEKITIKKIAADFKADTTKVTKWINEIYKAIFELNYEKPELFQTNGINLSLYMKHFDSSCSFNLSMPAVPREFEKLNFSFAQAKVGTSYFWVKRIDHDIEDNKSGITIWLESGMVNKYREFALDKSIFHGWIGFMDVYHKSSFDIDEELKRFNRN